MENANRSNVNKQTADGQQSETKKIQSSDFVKSPCKALAAKRQELGWSEEQVAARLKMTVRQIRAMEAGDYEAFHGVAIARGFVRSYACLMDLDPEPLVAFFAKGEGAAPSHKHIKDVASMSQVSQSFEDSQMIFHRRSGGGKKILAFVALALIVVLGLAWYMKLIPWHRPTPRATGVEKPVVQQSVKQLKETTLQPVVQEIAKTDVKEQASAVVQSSDSGVAPLALKFSGASWVQIQSEDGKRTIAQFTSKAGETKKIDVPVPAVIVIGNIKGVEMEYRNVAVDLNAVSKGNTAKIPLN